MPFRSPLSWLMTACACAGLVACAKPDHIETKPTDMTFNRRGEELWAQAIFKDRQGNVYVKQPTTWTSSDEKVAKVDNKDKPGNVTAVGPGHATITAHGDGLEAELAVSVNTVEKLKVNPQAVTLTTDGDHVPIEAQALDINGHVLKDRKAHMKCLNEKICNSDGDNVWPAGDPGETQLEVSIDDQMMRIPVTVQAPKAAKGKKK